LLQLAHDLPSAWNAPTADTRTKQRLTHILIQEVVVDLDDAINEAVLLIHWTGVGRCPWMKLRTLVRLMIRLQFVLSSRPVRHCFNKLTNKLERF
jgi:hypothetical protein